MRTLDLALAPTTAAAGPTRTATSGPGWVIPQRPPPEPSKLPYVFALALVVCVYLIFRERIARAIGLDIREDTFCALCQRQVSPRRKIGVGTLILAVLTGGFWLLLIPFYEKRCPICESTKLTKPPQ